jgi:hypothetical protein
MFSHDFEMSASCTRHPCECCGEYSNLTFLLSTVMDAYCASNYDSRKFTVQFSITLPNRTALHIQFT